MLGRTLRNRYQIIKDLGEGGFGDTYLAKDLDLPGHPHCVVKHFKPKDPNPAILLIAKGLFDKEAQTLYKLGKLHDQIPSLSAHFEENGEFYLVQDFIEGHDLTKELIPGKKSSESHTIKLLHDILEVLAIVHQQNVIHRDLKPANLMRRQDGKIILIDFGAVKEISTMVVNAQGQTSFTVGIGTSGYMPSEQAKGKPKLCSDIYAVGMIGIQALTGQPPHTLPEDPQTGEVIWRNQAQVSNNLANVLDKMVRDHFSQRYQNAEQALPAILSLSPPPTPTPTPPTPTPTPPPTPPPPTPPPTRPPTPPPPPTPTVYQSLGNKSPQPVKVLSNSLKTVQFETVTVNSKGQITKRSQSQAQVFTETIANGVTLEMVSIPKGSFKMGAPATQRGTDDEERPQHQVTIKPFLLGKYPITQAQWEVVANLPKIQYDLNPDPSSFKGKNLPVEKVSWYHAVEFCARLSRKTGRSYRLPSEAEWEYACRAGTTTPFHFGDTVTPDLANYRGNFPYGSAPKGIYREKTTVVGSFPPNSFGLYDMHGNVWEWCQDVSHDNYNGAPTDGSAWETGGNSKSRVMRGCSWYDDAVYCRAAFRYYVSAGLLGWCGGFRVAVASVSSSS
ncbi:SUMF1/EgtB/PvdO family nonheme iron enzyme [Microcoleus sp. LEGE 07076]|uniref:bifunctional serine/threonine-protein kinase/formylglycine-generating enzyme family protein n=1 Tax=Microcoleus sp. LEGE 07076 TaxID=915322 RepID=UPI00187ED593|nr:bifunctional serine/threonine-protein kinase/formylglycine-generating enzyme family protein [Microcoleus sp. LEGE 07076]MBE9183776.1 SUMF1/EgtB/PvdO family nonheme iron enzyme [Microcoleus sp. LEGE 07076]